jgi:hypothetical protein
MRHCVENLRDTTHSKHKAYERRTNNNTRLEVEAQGKL